MNKPLVKKKNNSKLGYRYEVPKNYVRDASHGIRRRTIRDSPICPGGIMSKKDYSEAIGGTLLAIGGLFAAKKTYDYLNADKKIIRKSDSENSNSVALLSRKKAEAQKILDEFGELKVRIFNNQIRPFYAKLKRDIPIEYLSIMHNLTGSVSEDLVARNKVSYFNGGVISSAANLAASLPDGSRKMTNNEKIDLAFKTFGFLANVIGTRNRKVTEAECYRAKISRKILDRQKDISQFDNLCEVVGYLKQQMVRYSAQLDRQLHRRGKPDKSMIECGFMLCKFWSVKYYDDNSNIISVEVLKKQLISRKHKFVYVAIATVVLFVCCKFFGLF